MAFQLRSMQHVRRASVFALGAAVVLAWLQACQATGPGGCSVLHCDGSGNCINPQPALPLCGNDTPARAGSGSGGGSINVSEGGKPPTSGDGVDEPAPPGGISVGGGPGAGAAGSTAGGSPTAGAGGHAAAGTAGSATAGAAGAAPGAGGAADAGSGGAPSGGAAESDGGEAGAGGACP